MQKWRACVMREVPIPGKKEKKQKNAGAGVGRGGAILEIPENGKRRKVAWAVPQNAPCQRRGHPHLGSLESAAAERKGSVVLALLADLELDREPVRRAPGVEHGTGGVRVCEGARRAAEKHAQQEPAVCNWLVAAPVAG